MPRRRDSPELPQSKLRYPPALLTWATRRGETVAHVFTRDRAMRLAIHREFGYCVVYAQPLVRATTHTPLVRGHVLYVDAPTMPAAARATERLLVAWGVIPDLESLR